MREKFMASPCDPAETDYSHSNPWQNIDRFWERLPKVPEPARTVVRRSLGVNETSVPKISILNAQDAHETRVQPRWNEEASLNL